MCVYVQANVVMCMFVCIRMRASLWYANPLTCINKHYLALDVNKQVAAQRNPSKISYICITMNGSGWGGVQHGLENTLCKNVFDIYVTNSLCLRITWHGGIISRALDCQLRETRFLCYDFVSNTFFQTTLLQFI